MSKFKKIILWSIGVILFVLVIGPAILGTLAGISDIAKIEYHKMRSPASNQ